MDSRRSPSQPPDDGRPNRSSLNDTALNLTLKWIERSSEAAELAVGDARLAEEQARAVATFYNTVRREVAPAFDHKRRPRKQAAAPAPAQDG